MPSLLNSLSKILLFNIFENSFHISFVVSALFFMVLFRLIRRAFEDMRKDSDSAGSGAKSIGGNGNNVPKIEIEMASLASYK